MFPKQRNMHVVLNVLKIRDAVDAAHNGGWDNLGVTKFACLGCGLKGKFRTEMNAAIRKNADMVKAIEADTALGRFGETSDIVGVVAFLASDEGR